ncbi:response regulator [Flavobacterium gyeonganense]|uniref:Response regulator n=1 Tax=Flavobacterium gyeonganense TaxID=1310418 RepID=A0ABV5HBW4_9FLAO|nr:response regulator [Flavobacterium gyeonganense]
MRYKNILQIDDDYDDCDFFLEALEEVSATASYTAIHNPVQALQKLVCNEIHPDVIFLDINMPVMNGMELLVEMNKKGLIKDIPVIILSTSIPLDFATKLENLGATGYYIKPHDFGTMKTILQNCLGFYNN